MHFQLPQVIKNFPFEISLRVKNGTLLRPLVWRNPSKLILITHWQYDLDKMTHFMVIFGQNIAMRGSNLISNAIAKHTCILHVITVWILSNAKQNWIIIESVMPVKSDDFSRRPLFHYFLAEVHGRPYHLNTLWYDCRPWVVSASKFMEPSAVSPL